LMSLFLHSTVADSRMARASDEAVMVSPAQKVCHAANDVAVRSCRVFSIDGILYVYDFQTDRRRNSTHSAGIGPPLLTA
jgi:hypothetical protein